MQYGKVTQASTLETGGDYFNSQLCDLLAMGLYTNNISSLNLTFFK